MRFSNAFLDEIRDRVPISDVIGRRVTWDRKKTKTKKIHENQDKKYKKLIKHKKRNNSPDKT